MRARYTSVFLRWLVRVSILECRECGSFSYSACSVAGCTVPTRILVVVGENEQIALAGVHPHDSFSMHC